MKLTEKLDRLLPLCDADERELIEDMISDAANYVKCVVIMESQAHNFAGREGQDYRDTVTNEILSGAALRAGIKVKADTAERYGITWHFVAE